MIPEERAQYWNQQVKNAERAIEYAREQRRKAAEALGEVVLREQEDGYSDPLLPGVPSDNDDALDDAPTCSPYKCDS